MSGEPAVEVPRLGPVLISGNRIRDRVRSMAREIQRDAGGGAVRLVAILQGARIFADDLARLLPGPTAVDCVQASSYGGGRESSGRVCIAGIEGLNLAGDRVVVVEDIVDSGATAKAVLDGLRGAGASSVRLAALLSKPSRRRVAVRIDYQGFEVPDEFVVGYGMDVAGEYRSLPDIHTVQE